MSFEDNILKKFFWKIIRTWLTSLHYTRAKQKKNIKQEKFVKMQQKLFPLQIIKKMVSTLCLPLPYYLWKGVACNQLHSVSFCEFLSGFIVNFFTWGYHYLKNVYTLLEIIRYFWVKVEVFLIKMRVFEADV